MKVAILGWGSLVWDPRELKEWIENGFKSGGPKLPIEFSRISKDHRLTLVIDQLHGAEVPTRFAISKRPALSKAIEDLCERERTVKEHIGFTDLIGDQASFREHPNHAFAHDLIVPWLKTSGFHAVLWTALPSNYCDQTQQEFSVDNAVSYLLGLPLVTRDKAFEYVRKAPEEVQTPVRIRLRQLGLA
jgi:hypothetical protein